MRNSFKFDKKESKNYKPPLKEWPPGHAKTFAMISRSETTAKDFIFQIG